MSGRFSLAVIACAVPLILLCGNSIFAREQTHEPSTEQVLDLNDPPATKGN